MLRLLVDDDDYDYNDDFGCGDDIESIICYVFSAILSFIPFSRIYNLCLCPRLPGDCSPPYKTGHTEHSDYHYHQADMFA